MPKNYKWIIFAFMRTIEEYSFSDLLNDINGYHLERWNKTTTAYGFKRYSSIDEWKGIALMEVVTIKSEKKVKDCNIGIIVNVMDGGSVQLCLTFKSEYVQKRHSYAGDKSMYRMRMEFLFSRLKCKKWVRFALVENDRCWLGIPPSHANEVPDLLWEIYKNILMHPCDEAYADVGKKVDQSATSVPDLSFSELDGI